MSVNTEKLKVENNNIDPIILSILLKDRTTNKNIIWATDNYKEQDKKYTAKKQITMEAITTEKIIKPRLGKTQIEQENRSRDKAEVFTPSWMCNIQNNLVDEMWFGKKDVFNKELSKSWKANEQKVDSEQHIHPCICINGYIFLLRLFANTPGHLSLFLRHK